MSNEFCYINERKNGGRVGNKGRIEGRKKKENWGRGKQLLYKIQPQS
jgi:hypothetical protein